MPEAYRARGARIAAAALAVLLASVLAACGSTDSTTTVTESSAPADEQAAATVAGTDAASAIPPTTTTPTTSATTTDTTATTGGTTTATTVPTTTVPPATGATSTDSILARPFLSDSPWNTRVSGRPVDPDSRRMMRKAQLRVATTETANGRIRQEKRRIKVGLTVNVTQWTVPVFSNNQPGAIPRIAVCRQLDCGPDAVDSITIPADACPDPRYDGWMTALDVGARIAYDFWRARCEADGSLSYHYVKAWPLDGPGFQQPTGVSARGSGLPLFAGLITPEEIRAGRIDHALAISVPGAAQRRYVQPASRTDGTGDLASVPEGARLRLRRGSEKLLTRTFVRNGTERATARTIITALERYGAIVVDRSAAPTMYAQRNADWRGTLPLNLLQDIPLKRFDVVQLGRTYLDPPKSGEQPALPPGTPGSVPTTTGGATGTTAYATPDTDFGQVFP